MFWVCSVNGSERGPAQVVELTLQGVAFLEQRFGEFDADADDVLSAAEQEDMFSTAPSRCTTVHG